MQHDALIRPNEKILKLQNVGHPLINRRIRYQMVERTVQPQAQETNNLSSTEDPLKNNLFHPQLSSYSSPKIQLLHHLTTQISKQDILLYQAYLVLNLYLSSR